MYKDTMVIEYTGGKVGIDVVLRFDEVEQLAILSVHHKLLVDEKSLLIGKPLEGIGTREDQATTVATFDGGFGPGAGGIVPDDNVGNGSADVGRIG